MVLDQEDQFKVATPKGETSTLVGQSNQQNAEGKGKGKKGESFKEAYKQNKECTCHKCGETSHIHKDCLQKSDKDKKKDKDKEKGKEKKFGGSAHVAHASAFVHIALIEQKVSSSHPMGLAVFMNQDWIMDSEATQNMTPMKKGIHNLCVMDGKILMEDNSSLQIQGIGDLDLVPNGSCEAYTCEVLYVLGLH